MPTTSESFVAEARKHYRLAALAEEGWWFEPVFPTDEPVESVTLASGLVLPSPMLVHVDLAGRPSVELRLEVDADELIVTEVAIARAEGIRSVTASAARNLPLKKIIDEAIHRVTVLAAAIQEIAASGEQHGYRFLGIDPSGRFIVRPEVLNKRTRRLVDDSLLADVAEVVRAHPTQPNLNVRRQLHTSSRNATRWIAAAKQRGFLDD
jgi:hypothetical protein